MKLDSLALYWNTIDDIGKLPTKEDWVVTALTFLLFSGQPISFCYSLNCEDVFHFDGCWRNSQKNTLCSNQELKLQIFQPSNYQF